MLRKFNLTDPDPLPGRDARKILLLVEFVPEDADHWGIFESMRGTSWAEGIEEVPAEALSHALHGRFLPLVRALGRDPRASARRITDEEGICALHKDCLTWDPDLCRPGGIKGSGKKKHGPPECYSPPLAEGTPGNTVEVFQRVVAAWKEGRHVLVVRGDGFNLA